MQTSARRSRRSAPRRTSWRNPNRVRSKTSPRVREAPPPKVHEWSRRDAVTVSLPTVKRDAVRITGSMKRDSAASSPGGERGVRVVRGGTPEAREWYARLYWETNDAPGPPVDTARYPLDVVIVETRVRKPEKFAVNDPRYQQRTRTYALLKHSCIVCDARGSIMAVFVTATAIPEMRAVARQARVALEEAKRDLKPRETFAVGTDYTRDAAFRFKMKDVGPRMAGSIWNDGLQTYSIPTRAWGGMYFTQYFRRRPHSDLTKFALPYAGMYAVERAVVPAIAQQRLKLMRESELPCAFPGIPGTLVPATQVGISENFAVKTHADSCVNCVTESIFWANVGVRDARFAVTSLEIAFDIGTQPCMLFQKGNEMHGTVPGARGSCGLVLISKRNTLQQFERGAYTDRVTRP